MKLKETKTWNEVASQNMMDCEVNKNMDFVGIIR